ncbi:nitrite reductase large subunit [Coleofasciculus sp. FACHB-64]|uniref:nitrite reductase large subunit NirB n=1 Tax=Cyanophyceae TaxID=3028117 RepID=UPI001685CDD3|nr:MULTISPECIES: nitrite reductase large subunit NirB [unclassified Coleofasciculus]MBD1840453.1 nitrite reductase large subunit [Coleofasciculus sp. FACHB-501]MBD2048365.1 nitrite reductase large subunit [Coleofasciculus sp. FACHB-64]
MTGKKNLIVIGNGMVGHKFLELIIAKGAAQEWNLIAFCEEPRVAYDRVNLSSFFSGKTAADLSLVQPGLYQENGVEIHIGDKAVAINREEKTVTSANGITIAYDKIVLATGSYPFVPPIKGNDAKGNFVYRTIDNLEAMSSYAKNCQTGVVVGGGLLGLECANALKNMGLKTHVVEFAPRLMPLQIDDVGGSILRNKIEELGVSIHTSKSTTEIVSIDGKVTKMTFADGEELETDMIVFSAGIRPRDEIARGCGLAVGDRGGIVINDSCQTSDPNIYAIGECALYQNRIYGLVAPGYTMASVAADILSKTGTSSFTGADMSTKLKLLGVDVASFGDAFAKSPGAKEIAVTDTIQGVYKKLVLNEDGSHLLGGILVGDAAAYGTLLQFVQNAIALPPHPEDLLMPPREGKSVTVGMGVESLPDTAQICSCNNVSKEQICSAIQEGQLTDIASVKKCTQAGTGCGGCVPLVTDILKAEMKKAGIEVKNHLCEHFAYSRQELYHLVRSQKILTFEDLIQKHGKGKGCEICKPAVASILASTWNEYILEMPHVGLQDTNDYYLANIQKDGTYSVIPRVPGGELTPDQLIVLGEVAKDFGLYTKITGGQRIDLLGARVDQLPQIWQRLIDAGFESGHAYGKALRTVKSCVGSTWCRFGVQDSTSLAIEIELRYRGLRAPHKLKSAVSGCTRECAEAQSKDFGIIATENGWNLYVCGNGGMKPQHAVLLATDIDKETLIKYLDRFLMFYIRTANRLERTATWFNKLEGGIEYLKQVVIEDSLGICAELESEMQHLVNTYQCEWKATIEDPEKVKRFRHFVNSDQPDPGLVHVEERGQKRPAYDHEKVLVGISE